MVFILCLSKTTPLHATCNHIKQRSHRGTHPQHGSTRAHVDLSRFKMMYWFAASWVNPPAAHRSNFVCASVVKRGLVTFYRSKLWTKTAAEGESFKHGNRRFGRSSALRPHTKAPYKTDLLWGTPRSLNRPWRAVRTAEGNSRASHRFRMKAPRTYDAFGLIWL
jgi:hypothetical protein